MSFFDVESFRSELESCENPLYFFHDDPDGLASYLILNKAKPGRGIPVKSRPVITISFARKVEEVGADKVFVLDVAHIDEEFIDAVKVPIIWLDHHDPQKVEGVKYYNPQIKGQNIPTPALCHEAFPVSLWNAVIGSIAEWYIPEFLSKFEEQYPDMIPKGWKTVGELIYDSPIAKLIEVYSFALKGITEQVRENVKILSKVEDIKMLLDQTSPAVKKVWRHHAMIRKEYDSLYGRALQSSTDDTILLFKYESEHFSLTRDIANELSYRFPAKFIILARHKDDEYRCSFRGAQWNVKQIIDKALVGVRGYGGGHDSACGGAIKEGDFEVFIENIRGQLSTNSRKV